MVDHGKDLALAEIAAQLAGKEPGSGLIMPEVSFRSWPMRQRLFGGAVDEKGQLRGEVECGGGLLRAWIVTGLDDDTVKVFTNKSERHYIPVAPAGLTIPQCEAYAQLRRDGLSVPATMTVVRALEIEGLPD